MHAHWPSVLSDEPWIWVGFLIAFVGLGLLGWLEQRSRLADLGVRGISTLWAPSLLVGAGWMAVVTTGNPFSFIWFIVLMLPTVGHPKPGPAAEGALQQRIEELGRKAGVRISDPHTWSWGETNVCVVHDTFRWWPATASSVSYVFVPLRFLNWLSRREIDALVARQLRAKRPQGKSQLAYISVLVYGVAAATVLYWLHVDPRTHWFAPILLITFEVCVLAISWPRISLQAHLRAIQITGDAEAYISALAELSRLNKTRLDESLLRKICDKQSVPPQRLQALKQPQVRPVEDRYPITEAYFKAGV